MRGALNPSIAFIKGLDEKEVRSKSRGRSQDCKRRMMKIASHLRKKQFNIAAMAKTLKISTFTYATLRKELFRAVKKGYTDLDKYFADGRPCCYGNEVLNPAKK